MAKLSKTLDDLDQYSGLLWGGNALVDAEKVYLSWTSDNPWSVEAKTNYKNFIASMVPGNGPGVYAAFTSFSVDVLKFYDNQDSAKSPELLINMIQSFGALVEASGTAIGGVNGTRVEVAGIAITFYGNLLEASYNTGVILGEWWQSVTQTDAKREAEIYASSLARSLDPAFTEATAKVFIDGSKSNDTGIGESVAYIKNIRKLLGLGDVFTAATANDVYDAVQQTRLAIQTLFGDSQFEISVPGNARTDLSAFLSLYYLVPFSIKPTDAGALDTLYNLHATIADQWNDDRNLTAEQIANGEANFSDMYLNDRAAMLGWVLKSNLDDTAGRADGLEAIYEDKESGINLSPIISSNTPKFIFGDIDSNAITGGNKTDHLYGMGGNDEINGGDGNDYLEGNAGNDTLNGEAGNDTLLGGNGNDDYLFAGNFGTDIITDSDGSGTIKINSQTLNSGAYQLTNIYKDETTGYTVTKLNGGATLVISKPDETGTPNRIIINDWSSGDLSIDLTGSAPHGSHEAMLKQRVDPYQITRLNGFKMPKMLQSYCNNNINLKSNDNHWRIAA